MIPVSAIATGPRRLADVSGMPATTPMPTKNPGDVLTSALWNTYVRDNIDKLLTRGHRVLTVAQFAALTGLEGTKGTVPPDEVYLEVDSTNGIQWHLAYESGEPTYKWRFLGGPPMISYVAALESTTSSAYVALTTAGPSLTLARGGDYVVHIDCVAAGPVSAGAGFFTFMSFDVGVTAASDNDAVYTSNQVNQAIACYTSIGRDVRKTGLTGPLTLTAKYRNTAGTTANYQFRMMTVYPIRIV